MTDAPQQPQTSDTQAQRVLVSKLGSNWKLWQWLSQKFSTTSLATIIAILAGGWQYFAHIQATTSQQIASINQRLTILETTQSQIIPEMNERLGRMEDGWFYAKNVINSTPTIRLRKRPRDKQ